MNFLDYSCLQLTAGPSALLENKVPKISPWFLAYKYLTSRYLRYALPSDPGCYMYASTGTKYIMKLGFERCNEQGRCTNIPVDTAKNTLVSIPDIHVSPKMLEESMLSALPAFYGSVSNLLSNTYFISSAYSIFSLFDDQVEMSRTIRVHRDQLSFFLNKLVYLQEGVTYLNNPDLFHTCIKSAIGGIGYEFSNWHKDFKIEESEMDFEICYHIAKQGEQNRLEVIPVCARFDPLSESVHIYAKHSKHFRSFRKQEVSLALKHELQTVIAQQQINLQVY